MTDLHASLLSGLPVHTRELDLHGVPTLVLEGRLRSCSCTGRTSTGPSGCASCQPWLPRIV
jgi:hypothetical protein